MALTTHHPKVKNGNGNGAQKQPRYRIRRQFYKDQRAAVKRALTAVQMRLDGRAPSLREAAVCCGSNPTYVWAVHALVKAENPVVLENVLAGEVSLFTAVKELRRTANLVAAYREANAVDRITFGTTVGLTDVWDNVVNPSL